MTAGRSPAHARGSGGHVGADAGEGSEVTPEITMIRTRSRQALPLITALFVACGVVQVFLAGLGVFDDPRAFVTHREFGYLFGWLTLVVLVLALLGGVAGRLTGLAVLLLVQFALQSVLVAVRADLPAVAALHPLNGFALPAVGAVITRPAWAARKVTPAAGPPASFGAMDATREPG
jgi:hypothetical protein